MKKGKKETESDGLFKTKWKIILLFNSKDKFELIIIITFLFTHLQLTQGTYVFFFFLNSESHILFVTCVTPSRK